MSIVITDILSEYGSYYRAGSQGLKDLKLQFYAKAGLGLICSRRITESTRLELGGVTQGAVLQGWQKDFTAMGDSTFIPKIIDLFKLKVDLSVSPDDLEQSWLGFLADSKLDRKDWPLVRFLVEKLIFPKIVEDYDLSGIYKGVKGAVIPGTPLAIGSAMNGFKKIINDAITAGDITPIAMGAMPTDPVDIVDYIEEFVDGIPEIVRPYIKNLNVDMALARKYAKGKRQKYNMNYAQEDLKSVVDNEQIIVTGHLAMGGATKIWCTPDGNAIEAVKKLGNDNIVKLEENRRVVDIMTDFYRGVGFEQDRYVYTNDVELS